MLRDQLDLPATEIHTQGQKITEFHLVSSTSTYTSAPIHLPNLTARTATATKKYAIKHEHPLSV